MVFCDISTYNIHGQRTDFVSILSIRWKSNKTNVSKQRQKLFKIDTKPVLKIDYKVFNNKKYPVNNLALPLIRPFTKVPCKVLPSVYLIWPLPSGWPFLNFPDTPVIPGCNLNQGSATPTGNNFSLDSSILPWPLGNLSLSREP